MSDAYSAWLEHATFHYSEMLISYRDLSEKCCIEHSIILYPEFFDPGFLKL